MRSDRLAAAVLTVLACAFRAPAEDPGRAGERRSDEVTPYGRVREFFFHEARPDPLHEKYEELFAAPFPDKEFHQFSPFRPFEDVKKFNDAFEARGVDGGREEVSREDGRVTVAIHSPRSAGKPLDWRVNEERILLSFPPEGPARRYRVQRARERVIPMPLEADHESASVRRDGDWIKFAFDENDEPRKQGRRTTSVTGSLPGGRGHGE
jgi:hypothetical protein